MLIMITITIHIIMPIYIIMGVGTSAIKLPTTNPHRNVSTDLYPTRIDYFRRVPLLH